MVIKCLDVLLKRKDALNIFFTLFVNFYSATPIS